MNEKDISAAQSLVQNATNIVIIPHRNPDGDAMGSSLALYHILKKENKNATVILPNDYPDFLAWLPGAQNALVYERNRENTVPVIQQADLIFTLDFNALHRVGELENELVKVTAPFIMIDHHQAPADYATVTFSDVNYGSTCEMIYDFIGYLNKTAAIDAAIATCIYTGITTDSGSFRFPKTTSKTHRIVAELLDKGANNAAIHNSLFDNNSYNSLQLLGRALQNMKVLPDQKTAYITLSQSELEQFNYKKGDTEGIVNYSLGIKGIIFAAIFIENKEEKIIKISFRSQGAFDVNNFARNYFNGGGHINAAGGKSLLNMEDTIAAFEKLVKENNELNA
jgi:phosphoesterase RecJ-like protein